MQTLKKKKKAEKGVKDPKHPFKSNHKPEMSITTKNHTVIIQGCRGFSCTHTTVAVTIPTTIVSLLITTYRANSIGFSVWQLFGKFCLTGFILSKSSKSRKVTFLHKLLIHERKADEKCPSISIRQKCAPISTSVVIYGERQQLTVKMNVFKFHFKNRISAVVVIYYNK